VLEPSQVRRSRAWRLFEKRLRSARPDDPGQAAGVLDQASRAYIADRHNLSAEGLTRPQIEDLLRGDGMAEEPTQRLCDLLDQLQTLRYAPAGAGEGDVRGWTREIKTLLREGVR
jgi:hypothetical protein